MGNEASMSRDYIQEFDNLQEQISNLEKISKTLQDENSYQQLLINKLILSRSDNLTNLFPRLFECLSLMTIPQLQSATTKQDMAGLTNYNYCNTKTHYSLAVLRTLSRKAIDREQYSFDFLLQSRHKLIKETTDMLELYKDEIEKEWDNFLFHEF